MDSYSCCTPVKREYREVSSLSQLLNLVGEESRLKILCILRQDKHCVCEIEKHVDLSQSLISHHLRDLKTAEIIQSEKKGQWVYYSLTPKGEKITNLLFSIDN